MQVCHCQAESPLAIKPFLPLLTPSELHAVMAAGFASIAGTIFGMLTSFGVGTSNELLLCSTVVLLLLLFSLVPIEETVFRN